MATPLAAQPAHKRILAELGVRALEVARDSEFRATLTREGWRFITSVSTAARETWQRYGSSPRP